MKIIKKIGGALASILLILPFGIKPILAGDGEVQLRGFHIRTTHIAVQKEKLLLVHPLVITQISDVHICDWVGEGQVRALVDVMKENPSDLIIFTGDLIDANRAYSGKLEVLGGMLSELHAPLGKYAVLGNHDVTERRMALCTHLLNTSGFRILSGELAKVKVGNQYLKLAGLIDKDSSRYDTAILDQLSARTYNIVLNHRPDLIETYRDAHFDLQLSGHSHGGQVIIDGQPMATTPLGTKYLDGHYILGNRKHLIVNRGIGYSRAPVRIDCPPTIDVIILSNT